MADENRTVIAPRAASPPTGVRQTASGEQSRAGRSDERAPGEPESREPEPPPSPSATHCPTVLHPSHNRIIQARKEVLASGTPSKSRRRPPCSTRFHPVLHLAAAGKRRTTPGSIAPAPLGEPSLDETGLVAGHARTAASVEPPAPQAEASSFRWPSLRESPPPGAPRAPSSTRVIPAHHRRHARRGRLLDGSSCPDVVDDRDHNAPLAGADAAMLGSCASPGEGATDGLNPASVMWCRL